MKEYLFPYPEHNCPDLCYVQKSTHTVGAADIELFGIRSRQRISVRPYHTAGNARGNHLVLVYLIMIAEFAVYLQELCKRNTQQLLSFSLNDFPKIR